MTKQVMQQARDALTPLANAHFPIERENLSDDDVRQAGSAIAALEAAIAAPEPVLTVGHTMSAAKTPRELIEAARIKYFTEAVAETHEDLFHEYATTALSLLPSLLAAHDEEIAALKAAQPVEPAAPYQVTDGWQWVPIEPTPEMLAAVLGNSYLHGEEDATVVVIKADWQDMLAAAPKATA